MPYNESICDDEYCHTDREHPPHTKRQWRAIRQQRAARASIAREVTPPRDVTPVPSQAAPRTATPALESSPHVRRPSVGARLVGAAGVRLLAWSGRLAARAGDKHELMHIVAGLAVVNTGKHHDPCCLPEVTSSVDALRQRMRPGSTTFASHLKTP